MVSGMFSPYNQVCATFTRIVTGDAFAGLAKGTHTIAVTHSPDKKIRIAAHETDNRVKSLSPMKMLWCWRCKTEVPMLEDDEYRQVTALRPAAKAEATCKPCLLPCLQSTNESQDFLR
jgi:hypothetical protein